MIKENNGLNNPHGGIYLVSNFKDKDAVDDGVNHLDLLEVDGKNELEQAKILLKQINRTDKITSYAIKSITTDTFNIKQLLADIGEVEVKHNFNHKKEAQSLDALKKSITQNYDPVFLIALNKDDTGKYSKIIQANLREKGYEAHIVSILMGQKTVEQAYLKNKDEFSKSLRRTFFNPDNKFQQFLNWINESHSQSLSTGLANVDKALGGGLDNELYVLGAPSSIGKTTFALQIADHLASQKQHVFYYALEMQANQLISKSINRFAYQNADYGLDYSVNIPNVRKIYQGSWLKKWGNDRNTLGSLLLALQQYGDISSYLHIRDNMMRRPTASQIKKDVANYIAHTNIKPVVFVDYLQLLHSEEGQENQIDKQRVSDAIWTLKTISRDFDIPVIVISSFNRSAYNDNNADMTAFKESGDIDYSAEVMLTLSYDFEHTVIQNTEGLDEDCKGQKISDWLTRSKDRDSARLAFDIARRQPTRAIQLKILKNRFSSIPAPVTLVTEPQFDIFYDTNKNGEVNRVDEIIEHQTKIKNSQVIYTKDNISLFESDLPF